MIHKFIRLLLLSLFLLALLPVRAALADTGPKPTMEFSFKPESGGGPITITSGTLYECDQSDCSDAAPLREVGPQRFTCEADSCHATAYGFSTYHRLEIEFSDGKTRQSNIFQTTGFSSKYTVTVRPNDLAVQAQFGLGLLPPAILLVIGCVCVLIVVAVIVGLIIFLVRRSKKS